MPACFLFATAACPGAPYPPRDRARRSAAYVALAALAPLALAQLARAEVYKCAGEGGIPVYQEMPCPAGKELRNFQLDPPEITILPAPPRPGAPAPPPTREARPEGKGSETKAAGTKGANAKAQGDATERKHVRLGMTEAEVLAKLGYPDMTVGSKSTAAQRWTYMPAPGDPDTTTALVLTKGVVTDIERKVLRK